MSHSSIVVRAMSGQMMSLQVIDERSTDETQYMLWRMRVRVMQPKGIWGVTYNWNMVRPGPGPKYRRSTRVTGVTLCEACHSTSLCRAADNLA